MAWMSCVGVVASSRSAVLINVLILTVCLLGHLPNIRNVSRPLPHRLDTLHFLSPRKIFCCGVNSGRTMFALFSAYVMPAKSGKLWEHELTQKDKGLLKAAILWEQKGQPFIIFSQCYVMRVYDSNNICGYPFETKLWLWLALQKWLVFPLSTYVKMPRWAHGLQM